MTEMIDVLDEQGNPTGEVLSRNEVHEKCLWHASAFVWVVNDKKEVVLQLRDSNREIFPNKWDVSAAGHIDSGAKPIDTAVRETYEEIGLRMQANEFTFLGRCRDVFPDAVGRSHKEHAWVYLVRKSVDPTQMKVQKSEVSDVQLMPIERLMRELKAPELREKYAGRTPQIYQLLIDAFMSEADQT